MNTEHVDDYDGPLSFNPFSLKDWKREFSPAALRWHRDNNKRQWEEVKAAFHGDFSGLRKEFAEEVKVWRYIGQNVKTRGRLGREWLDSEGVRTVRDLDRKRELERKNRLSK